MFGNGAQALVFCGCVMGDALIHVKDFAGQGAAFEAQLEPAIHKGIRVRIFAGRSARNVDAARALVVNRQAILTP